MIATYGLLLVISIAIDSKILVYIWLTPILLGQPFLRLYLLAEHGGCAFNPKVFENTRTTLSNVFVRWIAWNMPYHAEHHAFPAVPFHRLPQLHAFTRKHLRSVSPGYWGYHKQLIGGLAAGRNS